MPLIAYAYKSGEIGFCETDEFPPEGTIAFADNVAVFPRLDDNAFRMQITVRCRLAHDGETLLVPGLPEAGPDDDPVEIFCGWLARTFPGIQPVAY